ncbi:MAG: peptidoglycan bridge formation glycyltransferase FemA/FemB family protein [Lentisphaeraceae bacterium]|nr:peptidoglycan bridge formation glycyltransferase FemA/FemB family protein [Lentisphaeraceae bacterium]
MKTQKLTPEYYEQYANFVISSKDGNFFISDRYRQLLTSFLKNAEEQYFIALDSEDKLIGVLPSYLIHGDKGKILNSLPFFGSHGGVVYNKNYPLALQALLKAYQDCALKNKCLSHMLITAPTDENNSTYQKVLQTTFLEDRITQVTYLNCKSKNISSEILGRCHQKTRNMIRKGLKNNFKITDQLDENTFNFLIKTHQENIKKLNGIYKPESFFKLIPQIFEKHKDYNIFTAWDGDTPIAGLLLFYFKDTIEYFTPVIVDEYRNSQALSALIFQAMIQGIQNGFTKWNWGGTWKTQHGVYNFKKRWGAIDESYNYHITVIDNKILNWSQQSLTDQFPFAYSVPFDQLSDISTR